MQDICNTHNSIFMNANCERFEKQGWVMECKSRQIGDTENVYCNLLHLLDFFLLHESFDKMFINLVS